MMTKREATADAERRFITQGNTVTNFEASLKKFLNLKLDLYAVCVSSGTAALHLAYLSLGAIQINHLVPVISLPHS